MTPEHFRRAALEFAGAVEGSHRNHPDFRVNNRIFATLAYPDEAWAMVKLPPENQGEFVDLEPGAFMPAKGAWGKQGSTMVNLKKARQESVRAALTLAWQSASRKKRR